MHARTAGRQDLSRVTAAARFDPLGCLSLIKLVLRVSGFGCFESICCLPLRTSHEESVLTLVSLSGQQLVHQCATQDRPSPATTIQTSLGGNR
jgi:hypothetical protein